jgi:heptosyltransferase-2
VQEVRQVQPPKLVILAPNWLGDAVMALPLIRDLHRAWPLTAITVAARSSVAPLYSMVCAVHDTLVLEGSGGRQSIVNAAANASRLAAGGFDAALLLPNSFLAAWLAWRANVPERWGIARDLRGRLLTRAIPRPRRYGHQVEYYKSIGAALGLASVDAHAGIDVPESVMQRGRALIAESGIADGARFVVIAPGAAYGRAKQWPVDRFGELCRLLAGQGLPTVAVGAKGDASSCRDVARQAPLVDLCGRTDLPTLAAIMASAAAVVSNDSGAMHLAAAVGARVVAVFGPTDDQKTSPLPGSSTAPPATVITAKVWCRPCMLRECPIDHRCMTRITAPQVLAAVTQL